MTKSLTPSTRQLVKLMALASLGFSSMELSGIALNRPLRVRSAPITAATSVVGGGPTTCQAKGTTATGTAVLTPRVIVISNVARDAARGTNVNPTINNALRHICISCQSCLEVGS